MRSAFAVTGVGLALLAAVTAAAGPPVAPGLEVRGPTACPTAAQVGAALVGLVAPPRAPARPDAVELVAGGDANDRAAPVSVRLRGPDGQLVAERRLPDAPTCEERARTAAVIVAAWEAHLRAGAPPAWPLPPPAAPPPSPVAPAAVARAAAPPPEPIRVQTSAALLASVAAGGVAPAAMLEADVARRGSAFAVGIGALAVGTHTMALASGRGSWRRIGGVVSFQSGTAWERVDLQLVGGLALTALSVVGEALPVTSGATIFDPGGLAAVRLRLRGERLSPWVEAAATFWPRPHTLLVAGSTASGDLPAVEAFLGLGMTLGQNR